MKKQIKRLLFFSIIAINIISCNDDDTPTPSGGGTTTYNAGEVGIEFQHIAGTVFLDPTGATNYVNSSGETFSVTNFRYYISNLKLIKEDGTRYVVPNSYFLIDANDTNSMKITLANIPGGKYTGVEYLIGVDSTRNVSGIQSGALDPVNGMFWSWTQGYIFMKLEGNSPAATNNFYEFHIGGFTGSYNTLRNVSIDFTPSVLIVDGGKREAEIHILTDVLELFKNPVNWTIAGHSSITMPGAKADSIASNYADMFSFDHIHNDPL
ncbi:MAG: MbnP family protein [Bacteroidota bacterium]